MTWTHRKLLYLRILNFAALALLGAPEPWCCKADARSKGCLLWTWAHGGIFFLKNNHLRNSFGFIWVFSIGERGERSQALEVPVGPSTRSTPSKRWRPGSGSYEQGTSNSKIFLNTCFYFLILILSLNLQSFSSASLRFVLKILLCIAARDDDALIASLAESGASNVAAPAPAPGVWVWNAESSEGRTFWKRREQSFVRCENDDLSFEF